MMKGKIKKYKLKKKTKIFYLTLHYKLDIFFLTLKKC